jgi:hypothetical protein
MNGVHIANTLRIPKAALIVIRTRRTIAGWNCLKVNITMNVQSLLTNRTRTTMPLIAKEAGRESTTSFIGLASYPIIELYHISGTKTLRNCPIIVVQKRKNKKQKQFVSQHPYRSLPLPSFGAK